MFILLYLLIFISDTDSFLIEIETADLYEDMKLMYEHLDTSNYPEVLVPTSDLPELPDLYSAHNKAVLGKFKDECAGAIIIVNIFIFVLKNN